MNDIEFAQQLKNERLLKNLLNDMKELIPYLEDDSVTDIAIPDSGEIIVTRFGKGRDFTGKFLSEIAVERIILAEASLIGKQLESFTGFAVLEGIVPKYRARFTAMMKPVLIRPEITIRKPSKIIRSLEQYRDEKEMTENQYEIIVDSIKKRQNIIVSGATGSGKTTFTNAIIKKMEELTPNDNFYIVEDTPELQCSARMKTMLWIPKEYAAKAVEESLRWSPDRIIFGEVRNAIVMKALLEAWNTGHSGNVTTIHANNALSTLKRIKSFIGNNELQLSDSIQLIVHLKRRLEGGTKINEVMPVQNETDNFLSLIESKNLG